VTSKIMSMALILAVEEIFEFINEFKARIINTILILHFFLDLHLYMWSTSTHKTGRMFDLPPLELEAIK
jgi:hypothetical protein